jgi:PAS domain S-box-containing protein
MVSSKLKNKNSPRILSYLINKLKKTPRETLITMEIVGIYILIAHAIIMLHNRFVSELDNSVLFIMICILIIFLLYIIIYRTLLKMKSYVNLSFDEKNHNYSIKYDSDKLLQTMFNKVKEGVAFLEIKQGGIIGNFINVNEMMINYLKYSKDEILNMSVYDILDTKEQDKLKKIQKQVIEESQVVYETVIISKDGVRIDIEVNSNGLELNGKKVVLLFIHDITARKFTELALFESEERYRKLIELLPDAVHIKQKGKIIYSNEVGAKLLGVNDSKEIIGREDADFSHPNSLKISKEREEKILSIGEKVPLIQGKIIRVNGEIADVEVASTAIEYNGQTSILSVLRDITQRKKSEELMQKMMDENKELLLKAIENEKLKTEFFTNISHEFKTPLNVILGVMQLVNIQNGSEYNNKSMEAYNKYLPIMKQNCFRLLRLINNLLDITKIEAGYLELNFKNHDIIKIIEDVTLSVAEYAKNNSISIIFDTEIEERVMRCDEEKIERIILNLLSNSIKYNKDTGEIYVNVYDKKESILISIRDTGIGIPKERLGEVFERFKRVDTSLHRINEGTGIGLALVKSLVEKHGGEISVNSKYGEGTEFLIELPVILLPEMKNQSNYISPNNSLVERINIEFSDIYKLN